MKFIKNFLLFLFVGVVLRFGGIMMMNVLSNQGYTKSESKIVEIEKHEEPKFQLPENVMQSPCVQFIIKGIDAKERETFNNTLKSYSQEVGIDYDLVLSAILGEQIRISCKGVRGYLKDTILKGTPMLFRSYDVSVGVAGIKLGTARRIKNEALAYGYGEDLRNVQITEKAITENDVLSAKLATLLVKNIVHRRELSGFDISENAGVVGTLYNMGNPPKKEPHDDPKIGGSVITIEEQDFVYGEISLAMYNYFKQQKEEKSEETSKEIPSKTGV